MDGERCAATVSVGLVGVRIALWELDRRSQITIDKMRDRGLARGQLKAQGTPLLAKY